MSFRGAGSALEEAGYEREGDVLVTDDPLTEVSYSAVAGADGYVAMSTDPEADPESVRAAASAEIEPPGGAERDVLAELGGPISGAVASSAESAGCVNTFGISDGLRGEAELRLDGDDDISPDGFAGSDLDETIGFGFDFGEPESDDGNLVVPIKSDGPPSAVGILLGDIPAGSLYDCEDE